MRREDHRRRRSRLSRCSSSADLELISEIERCRRLVEQQHFGRLRKRAGNDDALFFTAAERHVRALGEVSVPVAASDSRAMREIGRPFQLKRAEMWMAAHQHHLHHGVVERGMRLLRDDGDAPRDVAPRHRRQREAVQRHGAAVRREHAGHQFEQRRLAAAVRAEQPGQGARAMADADVSGRACTGSTLLRRL